MRLIDADVRSRCARHSASAIGSCVASVSVSAVAGRWRMPVPRSSLPRASCRLGQRNQTSGNSAASAKAANRPSPMARARNGSASQRPAQETTRNNPATVKNRAKSGQLRSHAIAYSARRKACVSRSRETASGFCTGSDGSGVAPLNKLSRLPQQHPSTTAAVRHPRRTGDPHPEIRITRRRDCAAMTS